MLQLASRRFVLSFVVLHATGGELQNSFRKMCYCGVSLNTFQCRLKLSKNDRRQHEYGGCLRLCTNRERSLLNICQSGKIFERGASSTG